MWLEKQLLDTDDVTGTIRKALSDYAHAERNSKNNFTAPRAVPGSEYEG
jgi:hypothetical protein